MTQTTDADRKRAALWLDAHDAPDVGRAERIETLMVDYDAIRAEQRREDYNEFRKLIWVQGVDGEPVCVSCCESVHQPGCAIGFLERDYLADQMEAGQ